MADLEAHADIDSEKLIVEVEKRPQLYNKHLKEYSDRNIKEQLWGEVCINVVPNWNELSNAEKKNTGKNIQKKWKNFKDCFARELATQRKTTSGEPAKKKRRKYIHFDALLFLLPYEGSRQTSSNFQLPTESTGDNNKEVNPGPSATQIADNNKEAGISPRRRRPNKSGREVDAFEQSLLNILKSKQNEEMSEDKNFALMLVPMLAKLNDDQKHYAKVELLNVMQQARYYRPPQNVQVASAHNTHSQPLHFPPNWTGFAGNYGNLQTSSQNATPEPSERSDTSCSVRDYYATFSSGDACSPDYTSDSSQLYDLSNTS